MTGMEIIAAIHKSIPLARVAAPTAWCAAAVGAALPGSAVPPTGSGAARGAGSTSWASGACCPEAISQARKRNPQPVEGAGRDDPDQSLAGDGVGEEGAGSGGGAKRKLLVFDLRETIF